MNSSIEKKSSMPKIEVLNVFSSTTYSNPTEYAFEVIHTSQCCHLFWISKTNKILGHQYVEHFNN